jgi:hypothetical protein
MMMLIMTELQGLILVQEGSVPYELCLEYLTCVCCSSKLHRSSRSGMKSEFVFTFIKNSRDTLDNLLVYK